MKEEISIPALQGTVHALSIVLTQVIACTMTPLQAAQAAVAVKIERETLRDAVDYSTPEEEIAATERILDLYVDLLSAAAQRD